MRVRAFFDHLWERHCFKKDLNEMKDAVRQGKMHLGLMDQEVMWGQILPVMGDNLKIWEVTHPRNKYSDSLNMPLILNKVPYNDFNWVCKQLNLDPKELIFIDDKDKQIAGRR